MFEEERYYVDLACAFARGRLPDLTGLEPAPLLEAAAARGLKLHKFKRSAELPRVRRVIGALHQLAPRTLLDVGSGRGVFLWPLLDALPETRVTAIDEDPIRARDLEAVRAGGVLRLEARRMDAARMDFEAASFDVVTILEVLEHVPDPVAVAREVVRVARGHVVASVPSEPDDNPEHVRLFDARSLSALFEAAGAARPRVEKVRGHFVLVAAARPA
jgi:2-polyprenyl-3-methyl-5-hydroxy-6-metoxy-1,4-benzoquinol methylase